MDFSSIIRPLYHDQHSIITAGCKMVEMILKFEYPLYSSLLIVSDRDFCQELQQKNDFSSVA